jgi:hypothetical protein
MPASDKPNLDPGAASVFRQGQAPEGLIQHGLNHGEVRPLACLPGNDLAVVQIQNGRQIQFLAADVELGHVRDPLLIRFAGFELALEQIRGYAPHLCPIRPILPRPHERLQAQH